MARKKITKSTEPSKRKSAKPAKEHKKQLTPLQQLYKKEIKRLQRSMKRAEKKGYIFKETALPTMPKRVTKQALLQIQKTKPEKLYKKAVKVDYETGEITPAVKARKIEKQQAIEKAKQTRELNKILKEIQVQDIPPITTPDGYTIDPTTGEILQHPEPKHEREKYNKEHGLDKYKNDKPIPTPAPQEDYPRFSTMIISNFREDISHFPAVASPMLNSWIDELIGQYGADDVAEMLEDAKGAGIWIDYTVAYRKDLLLGMVADMMEYLPDASDWFKQELSERLEYSEDWESPD